MVHICTKSFLSLITSIFLLFGSATAGSVAEQVTYPGPASVLPEHFNVLTVLHLLNSLLYHQTRPQTLTRHIEHEKLI